MNTTKPTPQVGDIWQTAKGRVHVSYETVVTCPGHWAALREGCFQCSLVHSSELQSLLYRPGCDAALDVLRQAAQVAASPLPIRADATAAECLDVVRSLRESAERVIATQQHALLATRADREELDKLFETLAQKVTDVCKANGIAFNVGEKYTATLDRIDAALKSRHANVRSTPRVEELSGADEDALMDLVLAWQDAKPGGEALRAGTALTDFVDALCAKARVGG